MSLKDNLSQLEQGDGLVPKPSLTLKLLIVQEAAQNPEAIARLLHGYNLTWQQATTEDAFRTCLTQGYDLIIADYNHHKLGVAGVLQLLREKAPNVPAIVINGAPDAAAAVECMKAGATDYLLSLQLLPTAVEQALVAKTRFWRQQTQTQAQLQTLIAENADGIIVVDRHRTIRFVNPAAQALLGRQAQELVGQEFGFPVASDYLEVDLPSRNGDYRVAQMRAAKIHWQEDTAYLISLRDITELKRIELERVQLLEQAEAANRAKDEFLAILSHELRTPLNPILGWTKLLQRGNLDQAKTAIALETIERNVNLQVQLIEDLLDISRIIQGKLKLDSHPVDLAIAIDNALDTVGLAAQAKSIQIDTELVNTKPVHGDPTRLQQVVWNLVSNAIKFTPAGGRVAVKLVAKDGQAHIQVSDTGKGIAPEFLPYVFDYFRQADSTTTRAANGLGLGLAIVRQLVELHGGTVSAQSPGVGQGATFTVTLPLVAFEEEPSLPSLTREERSLDQVRILIVEDEEDVRDLLVFVLEQEGAQATAVASVTEALALITQLKPEILVSDIGMSELNGYELIKRVRSLPPEQGGNIPALALSAFVSNCDRQRSLEAGFNQHLGKPIDIDDFIEAITQLIG